MKCAYLVAKKDAKIPFYEKLPKTNMFCRHYIENLRHKRIIDAAESKADQNRIKFESASEKIDFEKEKSRYADSPESNNYGKKTRLYD